MTKQEYINQLQNQLKSFDAALAAEIIEDCEAHFRAGKENGKTEEEICEELGSVDEIVEELSHLYEKKSDKDFHSTVNNVVNDAINIANSIAGSLVKEIKSGIDYGKRTWTANVQHNEKTSTNEDSEEVERDAKNSKLKKAVIDGGCADVVIARSPDSEFHIEYVNAGSLKSKMMFQFHGEEKGDCYYGYLSKKEGTNSLFQMINSSHINIILHIPNDFELLEVKTSSGDIEVDYADVDEILIASASGDIAAHNINVQNCKLKSASGDISLVNGKGTNLKIKSGSGDGTLEECFFQQALIKLESGDFSGRSNQITNLVAKIKSGDLYIDGLVSDSCTCTQMSGDIQLINSRIEMLDLNTISGDINVKLDQEVKANIQTISGDVNIQVPKGTEGYRADINTVSGEATIDFEGEKRYNIQKGMYTMGEGKSSLTVSTVSGDIVIQN